MAPIPIKSFLKDLTKMTRAGVGEAENLLKSFKSDIKSLNDIVTTLPVTKTKYGFIEMAENSVGKINKVLREGDLAELVKISGKNVPFTSVDTKAFKSLVADTPERAFKDVSDIAAASKKSVPQLDLKEADFGSMSKTAANDVKKVESNLFKYFKEGTKIALTLGAIYVGVDWLTKATEKRKGCFMLTTIDGKTTSCKVQAYSCIGSDGDFCQSSLSYYNITLVLMKVATLPNTNALKIKISNAAGVNPSEVNQQLANIMDTKYSEVSAVIINEEQNLPQLIVCDLIHPDIEKGIVPPCRMCSPSDNPISTTYIDPSQYPDNVTFHCSINPSLLDTIADAAKNTGKDLLDGITGGLGKLLKPLLMVAGVILAIILIIWIGMRVITSRKTITQQHQQ